MNLILSAESLQIRINQINGLEIAKKLKPECKVFVRTFATTWCMVDYMEPSILYFTLEK